MRVAKEIRPEIEQRLTALAVLARTASPLTLRWTWKDQFCGYTSNSVRPRPWSDLTVTTLLRLNSRYSIVGAGCNGQMSPVPGCDIRHRQQIGDFVLQDADGNQWVVDAQMLADSLSTSNAGVLLLAQMLAVMSADIENENRSIDETVGNITVALREATYWLACDALNGPYSVESLWDDAHVFLEAGDMDAKVLADEFEGWLRDKGWTHERFGAITDMGSRRLTELEVLFGEWRTRRRPRVHRNRTLANVQTSHVLAA